MVLNRTVPAMFRAAGGHWIPRKRTLPQGQLDDHHGRAQDLAHELDQALEVLRRTLCGRKITKLRSSGFEGSPSAGSVIRRRASAARRAAQEAIGPFRIRSTISST